MDARTLVDLVLVSAAILCALFIMCCGCGSRSDSFRDRVQAVNVDFDDFEFETIWTKKMHVPWLGCEAELIVTDDDDPIPEKSKEVVRFACQLPLSSRDRMESAIYQYYQSRIFNSYDGGEEVTPRLHSSEEIWNLISGPSIACPDKDSISRSNYFIVTFDCEWHPGFGVSVLFNADGEIVDVGSGSAFL